MTPSFLAILVLSSVLAMLGAGAGVWLTSLPDVARKMVPISGAVLLALSLLWVLPELGETFGWPLGPALMMAGFMVLWVVDRFLYPVCPACSHTHDHDACSTRLHGFAMPLIVAAMLHSIFDGWALAAGHVDPTLPIGEAMVASVLVHKIPESIAYGVILRAALQSKSRAMIWATAAQAVTVAGALLALASSQYIGSRWVGLLLAVGGGTFLYLGYHAVHGEWKRRAAARAVRIS